MPEPFFIFAGGGSGGHLYPGIAVAEAMREIKPSARVLFLCTERPIDRVILEPTGFEFLTQPVVPPVRSISGIIRFWRRWRASGELVRRIFRDRPPSAVLGLGGYAAGVAVKLAGRAGIPAAILNPDLVPGAANQYLLGYVRAVCCQFEQTREQLDPRHHRLLRHTGCPIRHAIFRQDSPQAARQRLGLDPQLHTLVITGASQGAVTVNEAMLKLIPSLRLEAWQVLHLAGRDHARQVSQGYRDAGVAARVLDFTPEMGDVWSSADLAVSRSGASSCAELTACGVASVLMPYPFHKDMHQLANARVLEAAGAAKVVTDFKDAAHNAESLRTVIEPLLCDASERARMAAAARSIAMPQAAVNVAKVLLELTGDG